MGPRFPERPKAVIVAGARLNNINVSNSTVGTINTGSIGTIDQAITVLGQVGSSTQAEAVKHLSEAILKSGDLSQDQKNELVEILSVVAKEAAVPAESRRRTMAKTLIERAASVTSLASDVTDVCARWWPVILATFGTLGGG